MSEPVPPRRWRALASLPGVTLKSELLYGGQYTRWEAEITDASTAMIAEMMGCRPVEVSTLILARTVWGQALFTGQSITSMENEEMAKPKSYVTGVADARPRIWMRESETGVQFRCHPSALWRDAEDMHTAMLVALGGDDKADCLIFWETRHVD